MMVLLCGVVLVFMMLVFLVLMVNGRELGMRGGGDDEWEDKVEGNRHWLGESQERRKKDAMPMIYETLRT